LNALFQFGTKFGLCGYQASNMMKRIVKIIPLVFLLSISSAAMASLNEEVLPGSRETTSKSFVFKADRKYIGASIEVCNENGDRLMVQKLEKRKVKIDFGQARSGEYTIRIRKNNTIQEYRYVKK